jgi:hypothetical protein
MVFYNKIIDDVVNEAINKIVRTHDLDFERLWLNFNRTDRSVMISLSKGVNPMQNRQVASSTSFSAIKRLIKYGYIIRVNEYEIEDPFFKECIVLPNLRPAPLCCLDNRNCPSLPRDRQQTMRA